MLSLFKTLSLQKDLLSAFSRSKNFMCVTGKGSVELSVMLCAGRNNVPWLEFRVNNALWNEKVLCLTPWSRDLEKLIKKFPAFYGT
jgi:hypothetical protein